MSGSSKRVGLGDIPSLEEDEGPVTKIPLMTSAPPPAQPAPRLVESPRAEQGTEMTHGEVVPSPSPEASASKHAVKKLARHQVSFRIYDYVDDELTRRINRLTENKTPVTRETLINDALIVFLSLPDLS